MKNQKGITLVALIFTVIIMLILFSVSVEMLTNEDKSAVRAVNDLKNVTNEILEQHDESISGIIDEIKSSNIYQ